MNDEILDIVDANDCVVGQKYRTDVYAQKLGFRVINAFLINDEQKIWIPRRSPTKKLFPNALDASVGGHVMTGESYDQAFIRELAEELNLDASDLNYKFIGKLSPVQHFVSAHMHLYLIYTNNTPDYNKNDFIESHWFSLAELEILIRNDEPMKGDLPKLIHALKNLLPQIQ